MSFPELRSRVSEITGRIAAAVARGGHGQTVTIIAVTKTFGPEAVRAAADAGLADIGENKVQEARTKQQLVDVPVRWHLIGHLQRNKVKALEHFHLLHAVDRASLADAVHTWASSRGTPMRTLVQVNVAGEETKGGYAPADLPAEAERMRGMTGLDVRGVMTMAPFDASESVLRACFAGARAARDVFAAAGHRVTELSMGMSSDYEIAVEEGATMVRLGTVLFGARA
ncbi:MAG TPA: YggS family pyridoxal phosphate-dependent enzyme [Gemmatimonadaceae bacterium]|nr:YggS family pyridoxal phosphate-dependent enzyme [Gemmatimonadaceae bacterium]